LKAVLTKTAYQISSTTVEESTGKKPALSLEDGAARCFTQAASKASEQIVYKIAYSMASAGSALGGVTVNVIISGISVKEVEALEEALNELVGKSGGVYERGYITREWEDADGMLLSERGFNNGLLEVDVVSEKTARNLASFLSENGIEIEDITAQTINGKMSKKTDSSPSPKPDAGISVKVENVLSFKDADAIEEALRQFIGDAGEIESAYEDNVLDMSVTSGKTARNIASFLSEKGIEIEKVTAQGVSGKANASGK
jgi:glycine cleavage system regulatory protein